MNFISVPAMVQKTLGLAILAGLFSGCGVAGEMVTLELRPGVTLQAPAGTQLREGAGTDSTIGTISGQQFECSYDLGLYSNPLTGMAGAEVSETEIAGRKARMIAQGGKVDGLHVVQIDKSVIGNVNLTITCESETEEARAAVRAMFLTLAVE